MKVKTYRAATLKAALEKVKQELGSDAFILGQKEIRPSSLLGLVQKSVIEVTAAVDHSSVSAPSEEPATAIQESRLPATDAVHDRVQISHAPYRRQNPPQATEESPALLDEVRKLKALVRSITTERRNTAILLKPRNFPSAACEQLCAGLIAGGIEEELAFSLTSSADASAQTVSDDLAADISVYPDFLTGAGPRGPEVVALLGPTGVGKTTTIAKLAALASFQKKLKVGLVTLDTFRIAAIEQLKTYGEIMGIPVRAVESVNELRSAIQSLSDRDVVLIDTAGRNHRELSQQWELAEFLSESARIKKVLVVSATTKPSDLADIVDRHKIFDPNCLIFTKLDETDTHGSIISEIVRCRLPLAYVTTGQGVPNDISRPSPGQLVDLAISPHRAETWNDMILATRPGQTLQSPEATYSTRRLAY